ncbi:MAG: hypothetical protein ACYCSO_07175 [Cuniculiplasma sp.]
MQEYPAGTAYSITLKCYSNPDRSINTSSRVVKHFARRLSLELEPLYNKILYYGQLLTSVAISTIQIREETKKRLQSVKLHPGET